MPGLKCPQPKSKEVRGPGGKEPGFLRGGFLWGGEAPEAVLTGGSQPPCSSG